MRKRHTVIIRKRAKMRFTATVGQKDTDIVAPSAPKAMQLVLAAFPKLLRPGNVVIITVKE